MVLDTNVVSEPMKLRSDPAVEAWLDRQAVETLFVTATSLAEMMAGISILPAGKKQDGLRAGLDRVVGAFFGPRVLVFDGKGAAAYAGVVRRARANGYRISVADGQIAAVAELHGYAVATRDTAPFRAAGLRVIDPWVD